jgi:hypothetical protein
MKIFRAVMLIAGLLACSTGRGWSAGAADKSAAPDWVARGAYVEAATLHAVGSGMTRVDALACALGELAKLKTVQVSVDRVKTAYPLPSQSSESMSAVSFGNVAVSSLGKDYLAADGSEQVVSQNVRVEMKNSGGSFLIKLYLSSSSASSSPKSSDESSLQVVSANAGFGDLVKELERAGVRMKTYEDGETAFVGLDYVPEKPAQEPSAGH